MVGSVGGLGRRRVGSGTSGGLGQLSLVGLDLRPRAVFEVGDQIAFAGGPIGPLALSPTFDPSGAVSAHPWTVQSGFAGQTIAIGGTDTFGDAIGLSFAIPAGPVTAVLNPDGTLSVVSDNDPIRFTIDAPANLAGDYRVAQADLPAIAVIDGGANDGDPKVFPITGISRQGATLTATDPLWTYADDAGAVTVSRQWKADGANITGATGVTYVVDYADVDFSAGDVAITVEHMLVQGAVTRTYTSEAYTLVKPLVERIEKFKFDGALSTAPSTTFNLHGFEKILVAFGPNSFPNSLSVGGENATLIAQTTGLTGSRLSLYEFTITTPADAEIVANLPGTSNISIFGAWGINGVIKSAVVGQYAAPGPASLSRTPSNATNAIIAVMTGRSAPDLIVEGADSQEIVDFTLSTGYAGIIRNAPISAQQTVTWTLADRAGFALILVEPV